jgi:hypothetical protein
MLLKNFISSCLFIFFLIGQSCSDHESKSVNAGIISSKQNEEPSNSPVSVKEAAPSNSIPALVERKLIKNGEISFKTKSLKESKNAIKKALEGFGGYIAKENVYDYSQNPSEELIVRVPAQHFDELLENILKGADEIDSKKIDIADVTEEFVDVEARLKNKKQLELKYQELLAKAGNMEDILKIEKERSVIREDIESTEGRLRYLTSQVSLSTLRITYYEKKVQGFNFGGKIGDALQNGGTGFLWFLVVMVQLWPLWMLGGIIWFIIIKFIRRANRKKLI